MSLMMLPSLSATASRAALYTCSRVVARVSPTMAAVASRFHPGARSPLGKGSMVRPCESGPSSDALASVKGLRRQHHQQYRPASKAESEW